MDRSIMTNRALRAVAKKPKFTKTSGVTCPRCGGPCRPEEVTVTKGKDSTMHQHRVDILLYCADCELGQFLIVLPPEEGMKLALFSDVLLPAGCRE